MVGSQQFRDDNNVDWSIVECVRGEFVVVLIPTLAQLDLSEFGRLSADRAGKRMLLPWAAFGGPSREENAPALSRKRCFFICVHEKKVMQRAEVLVGRTIDLTYRALSKAKGCAEHTQRATTPFIKTQLTKEPCSRSPLRSKRRSSAKPRRNFK